MQDKLKFQGDDLLTLVFKWRKSLFIFVALSVTSAVIFSSAFFIDPLYKSEVILYPPATNSNKILIDYDTRFGADKEIDEHLQILRSGILKDSIIRKYALMSRYKINPAGNYPLDYLYKKYDDRVISDRTSFNAISVTVYDSSADTAAIIANDIVVLADKVKEQILKRNLRSAYEALERQYFWMKSALDSFRADLKNLKNSETDLETKISRQQLREEAKVKQEIPVISLLNNYELKLEDFSNIEVKYYEAKQKLDDKFPASYVITPAKAISKKVYPSRWLIIIIAGMTSLLVGITFVFCAEGIKHLKAEDNV
ncbi:MAG TPA: hypothetical protein VN026_13025 [Bacteroidia bacterium]|jgi:uncharacterized protein involved in exopolysaccharide biosynthesis|nr:hypothetical protein [Bacteroidia bacterium]